MPGFFAITSAAAIVSAGVTELIVVFVNSVLQRLLVEPVELMQAARILASEFTVATGITEFAGSVAPGAAPVESVASRFTSPKAFVMPARLVAGAPIAVEEIMNGASGHTAATVETSLTTMKLELLRLKHEPSAAIMAIAVFVPLPALPPVAVK